MIPLPPCALAVMVVTGKPVSAALALLVAATLAIKIFCEEELLRAAYPEYREYARRTKRLVPFVI